MINHPNRSRQQTTAARRPVELAERMARNAELGLIGKIADRAVLSYRKHGQIVERLTIVMDLTACHFNGGQRLRLAELLDAHESDFVHDIAGINRHLDRETYQLAEFAPRYAERPASAPDFTWWRGSNGALFMDHGEGDARARYCVRYVGYERYRATRNGAQIFELNFDSADEAKAAAEKHASAA